MAPEKLRSDTTQKHEMRAQAPPGTSPTQEVRQLVLVKTELNGAARKEKFANRSARNSHCPASEEPSDTRPWHFYRQGGNFMVRQRRCEKLPKHKPPRTRGLLGAPREQGGWVPWCRVRGDAGSWSSATALHCALGLLASAFQVT